MEEAALYDFLVIGIVCFTMIILLSIMAHRTMDRINDVINRWKGGDK